MNLLRIIILGSLCTVLTTSLSGQQNNVPVRSTEEEAARQTEKLQQELKLTPQQVKLAHEINLKYERERHISNTRADALKRVRDKDADLKRILTPQQYKVLQDKRFQRSSFRNFDEPSNIRDGMRPGERPVNRSANYRNIRNIRQESLRYNSRVRPPTKGSPRRTSSGRPVRENTSRAPVNTQNNTNRSATPRQSYPTQRRTPVYRNSGGSGGSSTRPTSTPTRTESPRRSTSTGTSRSSDNSRSSGTNRR